MKRWYVPRGTKGAWTRREFLGASAAVVGGVVAGATTASTGAPAAPTGGAADGALVEAVRAADLPCAPTSAYVADDA